MTMSEIPALLLRLGDTEAVEVRVHSRAWPGGLGKHDGNWLHAEFSVRAPAATWRCSAFLRAQDFAGFATDLRALAAGTAAVASFDPGDPWLVVHVRRATPTHFAAEICVRDGGSERVVRSTWSLPAARLQQVLAEVGAITAAFPVL